MESILDGGTSEAHIPLFLLMYFPTREKAPNQIPEDFVKSPIDLFELT